MNQLYLYVAMVGVLIVLFALTRKPAPAAAVAAPANQSVSSAVDQELKSAFDEFMNEIERENGRVLQSFNALEQATQKQLADQLHTIRELEVRVEELQGQVAAALLHPSMIMPAEQDALLQTEQPDVPAEEQPATKAPAFMLNEKYANVVLLASLGRSQQEIARETGIGIGEIQLVLGLMKREEER